MSRPTVRSSVKKATAAVDVPVPPAEVDRSSTAYKESLVWARDLLAKDEAYKKEQEILAAKAKAKAQTDLVTSLVPEEAMKMVDLLAPTHGASSCSDSGRSNGFYSSRHGESPRCARCALRELVNGQAPTVDVDLHFVVA